MSPEVLSFWCIVLLLIGAIFALFGVASGRDYISARNFYTIAIVFGVLAILLVGFMPRVDGS